MKFLTVGAVLLSFVCSGWAEEPLSFVGVGHTYRVERPGQPTLRLKVLKQFEDGWCSVRAVGSGSDELFFYNFNTGISVYPEGD